MTRRTNNPALRFLSKAFFPHRRRCPRVQFLLLTANEAGKAFNQAAVYFYGTTTTILNQLKGRPATPLAEPVRVPRDKGFTPQVPPEVRE